MTRTAKKIRRARIAGAMEQRMRAESWCEHRGWWLRVHDNGRQWSVHHDGIITDWWPSTQKLVHDKQWDRAGKAVDWDAVADAVASIHRGQA